MTAPTWTCEWCGNVERSADASVAHYAVCKERAIHKTPTLTDADREALDRIQIAWTDSPASTDGTNGMRVLLETIASQFLAAGMERAAKDADALRDALRGEVIHGMTKDPRTYGISHHLCQLCKSCWLADGPEEHAADCLAAIREQAKGD